MVWWILAQMFQVVGGSVAYGTVGRSAAGLIPHEIRAENADVSGAVWVNDTAVVGTLYVPVVRFSSGNLQRDQDVAEILEYRRFPFITITVQAAPESVQAVLSGERDSLHFPATLTLTVRDCTRVFANQEVILIRKGDTLIARTALGTRFTELGLEPPRVKGLGFLGGLVSRADDTLHLSGELRFLPEREDEP